MRMRAALVCVVVLLAGCGSQGGPDVEIPFRSTEGKVLLEDGREIRVFLEGYDRCSIEFVDSSFDGEALFLTVQRFC